MMLTYLTASPVWDWLTSPIVMSILLVIGLVGLMIEVMAPGGILPGIIGFSSFAVYFFGQYMAGLTNWEGPLFFIAGTILILFEIIVPGFGIFGIAGSLLLFYSVVTAASSLQVGFISLLIGIIGAALFIWILYRFFGFKATWNRMILKEDLQHYKTMKDRKELIGKEGITLTPLRPSGWAEIEGRKEDVVSEGEMIPKNSRIVVIQVEGFRVVVRKVENDT